MVLGTSGAPKDGSRQFTESLNMNISNDCCPDGENPHLHYVTLRGLQEYSPIMENLIRTNSMHLADPEHTLWDLSNDEKKIHIGIRSILQLRNFIQQFRVKDLGDNAELTLADSLYFDRRP